MPAAKVGDINIYYETHGEGEAVVFIMGFGHPSGKWFRQIPVFSREYRVVAFDNRGTGRSDKPDIPYTMEMMVGDIAGLLEAIDIDAAHIYGVSMGGNIAQHFALGYPERVISLVLGCTGCGGTHGIAGDPEVMQRIFDPERMRRLSDPERMQRLTLEEAVREFTEGLAVMVSQEFIDNNPDIIEQWVADTLEHNTPLHGLARQGQALAGHDTYDRLPEIEAPTLVIAGDADKLVPVGNSKLLADRIPNAELVILEKMGHLFILEASDESNRIIMDFLKRHPRAGGS